MCIYVCVCLCVYICVGVCVDICMCVCVVGKCMMYVMYVCNVGMYCMMYYMHDSHLFPHEQMNYVRVRPWTNELREEFVSSRVWD